MPIPARLSEGDVPTMVSTKWLATTLEAIHVVKNYHVRSNGVKLVITQHGKSRDEDYREEGEYPETMEIPPKKRKVLLYNKVIVMASSSNANYQ
jgi:hypothetical protein